MQKANTEEQTDKFLTFKEASVLSFLERFPYLTPNWMATGFFGSKGIQKGVNGSIFKKGSAVAKLTFKLKKQGYIQTLYPAPETTTYAITKLGSQKIREYAVSFTSPKNGKVTIPWVYNESLEYRVLTPDKILYRFPFQHVLLSIKFLFGFYKNTKLVMLDKLKNPEQRFNIKSRPDFLVLMNDNHSHYRGCIEIENSQASKSRKYAKLESLTRDNWQWCVFVFKNQDDMKVFATADWVKFVNRSVLQKGGSKKPLLSFEAQRFAENKVFFTWIGEERCKEATGANRYTFQELIELKHLKGV